MEKLLTNKAALVTGASRGIGAAIARRLARLGARVAITYSSNPAKAAELVASIQAEGGQAIAIQANSADAAAIAGAVSQTVSEFGSLDILVNNAGVAQIAPIGEFSVEEFDRLMSINVRGLFLASREASLRMGAGGRIINIGSINGDRVPFPGATVYAMSKAAVAGFTRALARELGPRNITVNNIQPGPVDTDMNPADGPFAELLKGHLAINRYAHADEIAAMVAYLAGPEAGYVTGASLNIDGGFGA